MSQNPNFIVELFIRTLSMKHKLTFEKDKQEYFRVLFDTYLNGQGNPDQLKDYIGAGIQDQKTIDIIADEVIQWQAKAIQMKAAQQAKKRQQQAEKSKMEEYVSKKTYKAKEQAEHQRKDRTEKKEEHGRKKHKGEHKPKAEVAEGQVEGEVKGDPKGLKYELAQQGKEKCKFFPFCKNTQTCQYYHPSEKCTYFPNCRYGQSCLYEHESCKFKEKCTKLNCHYAHPFKKSNPIEEMMKSFMSQNNPLSRPKKKFHPKNKEHKPAEQQEEPRKQ